ncbi:single-stranded-DNA-specific exonuclease RecJ [Utexia brackfieldae]|uniref:single-stranded-DNA-specific exonuclease RecJ n=1 Tax=Utexia brackfieldae TaxID=3074108 RepID=UPI00370D2FFB
MNITLKQRELSAVNPQFSDDTHPLLQRLYLLRGIDSDEELVRSAKGLLTYQLLTGIEQGIAILYQAITTDANIIIVGDFDTDGATSTALMIKALRSLGLNHVNYIVPDRFMDGYGLGENVVRRAAAQQAALIITVDNGVSSHAGVALAHQLGIKVIITDHHLPPAQLPEADAIINPNLTDCAFPSKSLAGVGVAFYFILALRAYLRQLNWFSQQGLAEINMANLLDLVALGTVADVVTLDKNNRILVHQGISRIRSGYGCVGIKALIDIAKKDCRKLSAMDLSYILAPRLNAAGRMETMSLGIELLLCDDPIRAKQMAQELDLLNNERRDVEQSMQTEAVAYVELIEQSLPDIPQGIVIYHPEWHQGVIGILSARIKDRYYRPVISFAQAGDGVLKGSGRSINGFHLRDALERIDSLNPGLIDCFGGHAMAAGLTISEDKFSDFKHCFEQIAHQMIDENLLNHVVLSDGELAGELFTCDTARLIQDGGPWGQGFPEPLFDGGFRLHQQRIVGEKHLKVVVEPIQGGPLIEGIAFNIDIQQWPDQSVKTVKLAYHLDINEFRGKQTLQLLIRHLWPL